MAPSPLQPLLPCGNAYRFTVSPTVIADGGIVLGLAADFQVQFFIASPVLE
jgi:hypothetical protein